MSALEHFMSIAKEANAEQKREAFAKVIQEILVRADFDPGTREWWESIGSSAALGAGEKEKA